MRRLPAIALLLVGSTVQAEPLNYDYAYLKSGESHVNGRSFRNDTFGAYAELGGNVHVFGSLGDAGAYGNPAWKDSRAVRFGVGGHWLVGADSMFAVEVAGVRARFESPLAGTVSDTGWTTIMEFRQRLAPSWEAIAAASYTDVLGHRTREWTLGPVWHINHTFALGAFYRRDAGSNGFDLTLRTYY